MFPLGPETSSSNVLPLLSVIASIFLWLGADELQGYTRELEVQMSSAAKRVSRGSPEEVEAQRAQAARLDMARQALLHRLASRESEQMTRAKLVYELRQKCNAVPVACQVRLADLTSAASLRAGAGNAGDEVTLEGLGVSKARSVLSGSFKTDELFGLYRTFANDADAQWRINAIVVKGNTFEFDVERLVLRSEAGAKP